MERATNLEVRTAIRTVLMAFIFATGLAFSMPADCASIKHISGDIVPRPSDLPKMIQATETHAQNLAERGTMRAHYLLQLEAIPDDETRNALEADGIQLGSYIPDRAWVVSLPVTEAAKLVTRHRVSWIQPWTAELKLHPRIVAGNWAEWSRDPSAPGWVSVFVQLHRDVAIERGAELASKHGGLAFEPVHGLHGLSMWIAETSIMSLAGEEGVLWMEEVPPPLTHDNNGARSTARVDALHHPPYSLFGNNVRLFVHDGGYVDDAHQTFTTPKQWDRVTCFDSNGESDCHGGEPHPTHVAGTAAGDGSGSTDGRARGVAPSSLVLSAASSGGGFRDNTGNMESRYGIARNDHQADLANNSLGSNISKTKLPCEYEGDYGLSSELIDKIVRGDTGSIDGPVLMVWSNGNERTGYNSESTFRGRCGSNFFTTPPPHCAKNSIQVGATNSDGSSMTSFSSWGPCDDGRLEPVVTAPGCETGRVFEWGLYSSLTILYGEWGHMCGTSMAAPVVSGILSLFLEDWRALGYGGPEDRPLPALVKAMTIHTTRDQGPDGPDYMFGYGQVDAQSLIDLLRGDVPGSSIWETHTLRYGVCSERSIVVPRGSSELKATVAWDDPAAAAFSATALINDLDLSLVDPRGTVHRPWVLDPTNPMAAAVRGVNTVDNQEQVVVENPQSGTWTRVVCADLPEGPQAYGVVTTVTPRTMADHTCRELISNGTFADNTVGWSLDGAFRGLCPGLFPGQTRYCLVFAGATSDVDQAWTEVTIPADAASAELTGRWYMSTNEGADGHGYDHFNVEIRSGGFISLNLSVLDQRWDGYPETNLLSPTKLPFNNLDLMPWAGQQVKVAFRSDNNEIYPTDFWIDNLSLEVCLGVDVFSDGFESGDLTAW